MGIENGTVNYYIDDNMVSTEKTDGNGDFLILNMTLRVRTILYKLKSKILQTEKIPEEDI